MKESYRDYLLKKTTRDYNLISEPYARTRLFPSDDIRALADYLQPGEKVLDIGCGTGRLWAALKDKQVDYLGVDSSIEEIKIAKRDYPEGNFQIADALNLPLADNSFDKVYSIAVLHHLPSKEYRLQFLREAKRVLKPAGKLTLRVWDIFKDSQNRRRLLKYSLLKLIGKSELDFKDLFIPWKDSSGKVLVERYLHSFTKKELKDLAERAGFRIEKCWQAGEANHANIYLIAQK